MINARNIDGGVNVAAHLPDWTHLGGQRDKPCHKWTSFWHVKNKKSTRWVRRWRVLRDQSKYISIIRVTERANFAIKTTTSRRKRKVVYMCLQRHQKDFSQLAALSGAVLHYSAKHYHHPKRRVFRAEKAFIRLNFCSHTQRYYN